MESQARRRLPDQLQQDRPEVPRTVGGVPPGPDARAADPEGRAGTSGLAGSQREPAERRTGERRRGERRAGERHRLQRRIDPAVGPGTAASAPAGSAGRRRPPLRP
jgi:hypothetical protein